MPLGSHRKRVPAMLAVACVGMLVYAVAWASPNDGTQLAPACAGAKSADSTASTSCPDASVAAITANDSKGSGKDSTSTTADKGSGKDTTTTTADKGGCDASGSSANDKAGQGTASATDQSKAGDSSASSGGGNGSGSKADSKGGCDSPTTTTTAGKGGKNSTTTTTTKGGKNATTTTTRKGGGKNSGKTSDKSTTTTTTKAKGGNSAPPPSQGGTVTPGPSSDGSSGGSTDPGAAADPGSQPVSPQDASPGDSSAAPSFDPGPAADPEAAADPGPAGGEFGPVDMPPDGPIQPLGADEPEAVAVPAAGPSVVPMFNNLFTGAGSAGAGAAVRTPSHPSGSVQQVAAPSLLAPESAVGPAMTESGAVSRSLPGLQSGSVTESAFPAQIISTPKVFPVNRWDPLAASLLVVLFGLGWEGFRIWRRRASQVWPL